MPTGIGIGSAGQVFGQPLSLTARCDAQYCYEFDGATESATQIASYDFGVNNFSISIWFKTPDVTGGGVRQDLFATYTFAAAETLRISLSAAGQIQFVSSGTGWIDTFSSFTPVNDTWTHVVYSVDRSGNAVWYGDVTTTQSLDISANSINLSGAGITGIAGGISVSKFEGLIADVAQWDIALTAAQVQEYYDNSKGTPKLCANTALSTSPHLQGWWRFTNPSGSYKTGMENEGYGNAVNAGATVPYNFSMLNMDQSNVITDYPT